MKPRTSKQPRKWRANAAERARSAKRASGVPELPAHGPGSFYAILSGLDREPYRFTVTATNLLGGDS